MESLSDTLQRLRDLVDGPAAASGRMPPERVLASQLGIGRRSLRRALEVLEHEGRLTREQGRGTFVRGRAVAPAASLAQIAEHTSPAEVIELRLGFEPMVARLAAVRASQCDIRALARLAEETRAAPNPEVYEAADAAFHRAVVEAAHNLLFLAVFDAVALDRQDAGWQRLGESGRCFKRQAVYAADHAAVATAIGARDGERAAQAMHTHLSNVQRHILEHAFALPLSAA